MQKKRNIKDKGWNHSSRKLTTYKKCSMGPKPGSLTRPIKWIASFWLKLRKRNRQQKCV